MLLIVRQAVVVLALFAVLTGLVYPLAITGIAQALFSHQANGSLILRDGGAVGSELIGQASSDPRYFWSRPSATGPMPYNAAASSGSNLGPTNPALERAVAGRVAALHEADPGNKSPVPVDLVTASGSGLDPHISVAAALYQIPRIARARGLTEAQVAAHVARAVEDRQWGVLGQPRVNVLLVNIELDKIAPQVPAR